MKTVSTNKIHNWIFLTDVFSFLDLAELEDHNDRLRKLENQNKIANLVSGGSELGEDKLNALLNAINQITDDVKADMDKKLEDFVRKNAFDDLVKEQGGLYRRVQQLEKQTR